jgi:hypothetical protein
MPLALLTNILLGWEVRVGDKHSSFLGSLGYYNCKKFYNIGPRLIFICLCLCLWERFEMACGVISTVVLAGRMYLGRQVRQASTARLAGRNIINIFSTKADPILRR